MGSLKASNRDHSASREDKNYGYYWKSNDEQSKDQIKDLQIYSKEEPIDKASKDSFSGSQGKPSVKPISSKNLIKPLIKKNSV